MSTIQSSSRAARVQSGCDRAAGPSSAPSGPWSTAGTGGPVRQARSTRVVRPGSSGGPRCVPRGNVISHWLTSIPASPGWLSRQSRSHRGVLDMAAAQLQPGVLPRLSFAAGERTLGLDPRAGPFGNVRCGERRLGLDLQPGCFRGSRPLPENEGPVDAPKPRFRAALVHRHRTEARWRRSVARPERRSFAAGERRPGCGRDAARVRRRDGVSGRFGRGRRDPVVRSDLHERADSGPATCEGATR